MTDAPQEDGFSADAAGCNTKQCPFCAETILIEAVKCKHCGEFLNAQGAAMTILPSATRHPAPPPPPAPSFFVNPGNSPQVTCPHCGTTGSVNVSRGKQKKGVSGGKATAAVFTLGFSMLATGLSRKEMVTEGYCKNCNVRWVMG